MERSGARLGTTTGHGGTGGRGLGKSFKRHRKILRDTVQGITRNDIRRLARRGGVKRISTSIYDEVRITLKLRLSEVLKQIVHIIGSNGPSVEAKSSNPRERKTVTVADVVFVLNRLGTPIYGFGEGQR